MSSDDMTRPTRARWRVQAAASAVLAGAVLALAGTTPAAAATPMAGHDDAIQLSWDGSHYASTTTQSFVGAPVTVPGDSTQRTLSVRNAGPSAGTLVVSIVNVRIADPAAADHGNFYDDLTLTWTGGRASFSTLAHTGDRVVQRIPLERGAQTPVTIGYELPVEATSGNAANVSARRASFDVRLTLTGDTSSPVDPGGPMSPQHPSSPAAPGAPSASGGGDRGGAEPQPPAAARPPGSLALTGAEPLRLLLVGGGAVLLGLLLARQSSRSRSAARGGAEGGR